MSGNDWLFAGLWFPTALSVAWAVPPTPRWPFALVWFLIGAMTWMFILKAVRGKRCD